MTSYLYENLNQWLCHLEDGSFDRLIIKMSKNLFNELKGLQGKEFLIGKNGLVVDTGIYFLVW